MDNVEYAVSNIYLTFILPKYQIGDIVAMFPPLDLPNKRAGDPK